MSPAKTEAVVQLGKCPALVTIRSQAQEKAGNTQVEEGGREKLLVSPCTWINLELFRNHHARNDFSKSVFKI